MTLRITSLHRYPIKGCQGHSCDDVMLDHLGVVGDRRLMLVDPRGRFCSQREMPQLATLRPVLQGTTLTVTAPGAQPLQLEINETGALRPVELWGTEFWATEQGPRAAGWFSQVLGQRVHLVWFGPGSERFLDPTYSPRPDAQTAFTDGYPLLGVLQESLDALNLELGAPVPMNRFRPNLVAAGGSAWSETAWQQLRCGDVTLDAVKPCARCQVTTTDQTSGVRDPDQEPLRTLARLRTIPGLGAIFGQNLVPTGPGTLAVGDPIDLWPPAA